MGILAVVDDARRQAGSMSAEVRAGLALARSLTGDLCSAFHSLQVANAVAKGAMNLLEIHFGGGKGVEPSRFSHERMPDMCGSSFHYLEEKQAA